MAMGQSDAVSTSVEVPASCHADQDQPSHLCYLCLSSVVRLCQFYQSVFKMQLFCFLSSIVPLSTAHTHAHR